MLSREAVRMLRPMTILFSGPMEAGKTYHLMRTVQDLLGTADPCPFSGNHPPRDTTAHPYSAAVFCKPKVDTRTGPTNIASRNGTVFHGVDALDSLDGVAAALRPDTLVAVAEAQFFDASLLRLYDKVKDTPGSTLVVAGLDRDYRGLPFGHVLDLAHRIVEGPGSGRVHMLRAPCHVEGCMAPAAFTTRIKRVAGDGDDAVIAIGSSDLYRPSCAEHHVVEAE